MPSGKVHDKLTIIGAVAAIPVWLAFAPRPWDWTAGATLVGATLFSGLMLSPDLDLNSSIYHRWGPFKFLWWPYQKAIPHRSRLSHSLLLGPALRLAYFALIVWGLFRIGTWAASLWGPVTMNRNQMSQAGGDFLINFWRTHPNHFLMFLVGTFLGTALHVGADAIPHKSKKRKRRE
jgi:uncharacterized metal-binding protein